MDYGNLAEVDTKDALPLTDKVLLSVPPQAVHLKLEGVVDEMAVMKQSRLIELVTDQPVGVKIRTFCFVFF